MTPNSAGARAVPGREVPLRGESAPPTAPVAPGGPLVTEGAASGPIPLYVHPLWAKSFPWLIQGTTGRGPDGDFDLRLSSEAPVGTVLGRWRLIREELDADHLAHAGQVHGTRVIRHHGGQVAGISIASAADGHATRVPGILLTVSVADCIPISIVDPERRAIALLHGGWRGVAAGIIDEGIAALREIAGSEPAGLFVHLGPAICGECYEVGPEVWEALGLEAPRERRPIDLRAVAARRAAALGVDPARISRSTHCTRCSDSLFFSHRAGSDARQIALLGIGAEPGTGLGG